jgi:hypothetical protein
LKGGVRAAERETLRFTGSVSKEIYRATNGKGRKKAGACFGDQRREPERQEAQESRRLRLGRKNV